MRQTFRLSSCNVNCSAKRDADKPVKLSCYGIDPEPYECTVKHPESPCEFCFPPLASLITGGSHLLLALLERLVTDRGGTYAMEDTDSIAIVASKEGGLVACPFLRAIANFVIQRHHCFAVQRNKTPGKSDPTRGIEEYEASP